MERSSTGVYAVRVVRSILHACSLTMAIGCGRAEPATPAPQPLSPSISAPEAVRDAPLERALFRKFPALRERLPWVSLATLPSPIERSPNLEAKLGIRELWIKRDDRLGDAYGGSKLRKLEHLLGEAKANGFRSVLAQGGVGSNQTLSTAYFSNRLGLSCILLLLPERPSDETRRHLLAQHALGAEQHLVGPSDREVERFVAKLPPDQRPYVIPTGGSSALGDVGFVNAGLELAEQVRDGVLPAPDAIYLPLGTGGSAVGLAIGLGAAGLDTRVIAIRTSSHRYGTPRDLEKMRRETTALLQKLDPTFPSAGLERLEVREGFVGRGYAEPTAGGRAAQAIAREAGGLELDLTYSAKAFAALVADAPKVSERRIVFWLTYDARTIDAGSATPNDLPSELRGYAR